MAALPTLCLLLAVSRCIPSTSCALSDADDALHRRAVAAPAAARHLTAEVLSAQDAALLRDLRPASRSSLPGWLDLHEQLADEVAAAAVDGCMEAYRGTIVGEPADMFTASKAAWAQRATAQRALLLGISGDQAMHLLWRLQNGEGPSKLKPKAITLMIGTNDAFHLTRVLPDTQEAGHVTAAAVMQCIRELQRQAPQARIVVLGLLPLQPPHMRRLPFGAAVAVANKEVQHAVQRQASDKLVFKDCSTPFVNASGEVRLDLMPDGVHPEAAGARILLKCLLDAIHLLLLSLCNNPRSMRAPHPRLLAAGAALLVFTAFVRLRTGRDAGSSWARMPEVVQPAPRADAGWAEFQSKLVEEVTAAKAKQGMDIIAYGDSITEAFRGSGYGHQTPKYKSNKATWRRRMGKRRALLLGISGDQTMHLLWRLQNGEGPAGLNPTSITLMIGTNDVLHLNVLDPDDEEHIIRSVVSKVQLCVRELQRQAPQASIIMLGLLPLQPVKPGQVPKRPLAGQLAAINQQLRDFAEQQDVAFQDCGGRFLHKNGTLNASLMPDGVHPVRAGSELLLECMLEAVD
ncbi:Platelet-activating factor acetylhydrolase IB subunit beta [Chlorella vulgaris]